MIQAFQFGGHDFHVVDRTALVWPLRKALIVSDLHLEKASWFAARGQMIPPHDSLATLERIERLVDVHKIEAVWCLGDNFHDGSGVERMVPSARALLAHLTTRLDWTWITGNHDEHLPKDIGGHVLEEQEKNGLILRHRADPDERSPELSGHFHPKIKISARGRSVKRPCFLISATKLIFPAFGAFAGGLDARDPEIAAAAGPNLTALLPSAKRLLRFAV